MDRIRIAGGRRLNGTIPISGAKNATLPLMIASLLSEQKLALENVPALADVALLKRILANHGVDYLVSGKRAGDQPNAGETLTLSAEEIVDTTAPYDLVSRMRASFWVVGPLIARMRQARVSLPGGQPWAPFIIGGLLGAILLYLLFDWTLIVLSSFAGAAFISQTIQATVIPSEIVLIALFLAGILIQGSMMKKGRR